MIKKILLYFALLMWFVVPVLAQPTIFSEDVTTEPGKIISLPISFSGFEMNIDAIQFAVEWDSTVLQYVSLKDEFMSSIGFTFTTTKTHENILRFVSFDNSNDVSGHLFKDPTLIATATFRVIGTTRSESFLDFTKDTEDFELLFSDTSGADVKVTIKPAKITVIGPDAVQAIDNPNLKVGQNTPNPFSEKSIIPLELKHSGDVSLTILDLEGKEIYKKTNYYNKGKSNLILDSSMFKSSGLYFYQIKTNDYISTRKLFFEQH